MQDTFIRPNSYPERAEQFWQQEPAKGEQVEVDYGCSTNTQVWWDGEKFVNCFGFELYNILGWRPLNK